MKEYTITMIWSAESSVWIAVNDDIPMALESESFDKLVERVRVATPELLELNGKESKCILHFVTDRKEGVA